MAFIDLRITKEEQKKRESDMCCSPESDDMVPWGLRVELSEREIDILGMDKPEVGTDIEAKVKFRVSSYSENETNEGKRRNTSLAIISMDIGSNEVDKVADRAKKLYGDK